MESSQHGKFSLYGIRVLHKRFNPNPVHKPSKKELRLEKQREEEARKENAGRSEGRMLHGRELSYSCGGLRIRQVECKTVDRPSGF